MVVGSVEGHPADGWDLTRCDGSVKPSEFWSQLSSIVACRFSSSTLHCSV